MKLTTTAVYPILVALMIGAVALALAYPASTLRGLVGLAAVLFIPGYLLVGALFPVPDDLGWALRAGLSLALSIALQPLIAVLLTISSVSLSQAGLVGGLAVLSLGAGSVAWLRARGFGVPLTDLPQPSGQALVVSVLIGVVLVSTVLGVKLSARRFSPGGPTTEFYLEAGPTGFGANAETIPVGEPVRLVVGITNREGREMDYIVSARVGDRSLTDRRLVVLPDGAESLEVLTFPMPPQQAEYQDLPVDVVLQTPGESGDYRFLRIWLRAA